MWTSGSRNHTPKHHSPLPNKPDVLVAPAGRLRGSFAQYAPPMALNVDWEPSQAPFLDRAAGADGPGSARQRLTFHAALIGPHSPAPARISRNEVDVRSLRRERRIEAEVAPALHQGDLVDIIDQHDEMWNADATEHRLALTGAERESAHAGRRVDGRKMDLGATSFEAAAAVGACVGLELNPFGRPNGQMRRQRGTAERCIAAHGGVRDVGVVVDHARRTGVRTRSHEHDAVGPDARPPGAYRLHVLGRPVGCSGYTCIEHDEIVARSRHLVDRQADQMRPNQAM